MGADQTAAIRAALRELFEAVANDDPAASTQCITFTVPQHPEIWVQIMHGTINAAYPRSSEPTDFLSSIELPPIPDLSLDEWQADQYATWSFGSCLVHTLAEFIDRLLTALHPAVAEDYGIDVMIEHVA